MEKVAVFSVLQNISAHCTAELLVSWSS